MECTFGKKFMLGTAWGIPVGLVASGVAWFVIGCLMFPSPPGVGDIDWPAWVQAIGSIGAIAAAIYIFAHQEKIRRDLDQKRQREQRAREEALGLAIAIRILPYLQIMRDRVQAIKEEINRNERWFEFAEEPLTQHILAQLEIPVPSGLVALTDSLHHMSTSAASAALGALGHVAVLRDQLSRWRHAAEDQRPHARAARLIALDVMGHVEQAYGTVELYRNDLLARPNQQD